MKYFVQRDENLQLTANSRQTLRGSFAPLSHGATHFELDGPQSGELAVLVPGLTVPLFYWDRVAAELHARGVRTLSYSAYGRGYSERSQGKYDEAMFVRQLVDLLAHLNVETQVHLVGTSMGALIAMAYAVDQPQTVDTLSLIGPAGLSNSTALQQRILKIDSIARIIAQQFGRKILLGHLSHNVSDTELVEPLKMMISDCFQYQGSMYSFFATLQNYPLFGREDLFQRVGRCAFPTLLAWGIDDQVTPISESIRALELLAPTTTDFIDGCGHMAPYERPSHTADLLASFITANRERTNS